MLNVEYAKAHLAVNSSGIVYSSVGELLREKIIARMAGANNIYFVNPMIFYKGDVAKRYSEFVQGLKGKKQD